MNALVGDEMNGWLKERRSKRQQGEILKRREMGRTDRRMSERKIKMLAKKVLISLAERGKIGE